MPSAGGVVGWEDSQFPEFFASQYEGLRRNARHASQARVETDDASQREELLVVWAAIGRLPTRQRAVVVLRYHEDLPELEVARLLGIPVGTVKSTAKRALAR